MTPNAPFDRITVEPGKCGGKPCIRGMRITVRRVLEGLAPRAAALLRSEGWEAVHVSETGLDIDWPGMFRSAKDVGMRHFIVEQDQSKRGPLESIAMSYKNLREMKY